MSNLSESKDTQKNMTFSVNSLRKKTTQQPVAIIIGKGKNECFPVSCVHTKIIHQRRSWRRDTGVEREVQNEPVPYLLRMATLSRIPGLLATYRQRLYGYVNIISCLVFKFPFKGIIRPVRPNRRKKKINICTHMLEPWLIRRNGFLMMHEDGDPDLQSQITSTTPRK